MTSSVPLAVTIVMAGVMGGTALYCAGRLAVAPLLGRTTDRAADGLHVVMGAVMAASLLGVLNRHWDLLWVLGSAATTLWFLRSAVVAARAESGRRHDLQHALGAGAMLVMLASASQGTAAATRPALTGMRGMSGMGPALGHVATGAPGVIVVALGLGLVALAATEVPQLRSAGVGNGGWTGTSTGPPALAPRCAAACRVAMGLTMGAALLTML